MNILQFLEPLRGHGPAPEAPAATRYAQRPFFLLANDRPPFDAWHRPESRVPAGLEPLWRAAGAGNQLCAFHAVNVVTRGAGFAEGILALQKAFLDQLQAGLGDQHEQDVRRLYAFASQPMQIEDQGGQLLEVPSDWRIAVEFLLTCPESPYLTQDAGFSRSGAPSFPDEVDVALALDLEHAWRAAADHFGALVEDLSSREP